MPSPDQYGSPFRAAKSLPLDRGYGGKITSYDCLPIHALGDQYVVEGNGTVTSLPALPTGETVFLQMAGTPTFTNSAKLICPNGVNYVAAVDDLVIARSKGDGIWRLYVLSNGAGLLAGNNLSDVANAATARANIAAQGQGDYAGMSNGTLAASAASGALTVAVKTFAGADPSSADPVYFYFRDNTLTAGDFTRIAVTSALSVVLGSGATLGATSGNGTRVWIGAFNNAGAVQLAAMNCSTVTSVFCPQEHLKYTTAVPGNSAQTWYSTSAIGTAAPWRLIGFCEWSSLTTAGTWTSPTIVQLFGPGVKKPGDVVQIFPRTATTTGASATNTTTKTASANTITVSPSSAANLIALDARGSANVNNANGPCLWQISRGSGPTLIGDQPLMYSAGTGGVYGPATNAALDNPSTTSAVTYTVYFWTNVATMTVGYNVQAANATTATMQATEIMG